MRKNSESADTCPVFLEIESAATKQAVPLNGKVSSFSGQHSCLPLTFHWRPTELNRGFPLHNIGMVIVSFMEA